MENIIGILIFLAFLLFEALQRSKKNKQKQQRQMPGEPYPDEYYAEDPYALPPPQEPESDLERALREIQDALTSASEPKRDPAPQPLPERQVPPALPPRPLPTHAPETQPEVFIPTERKYRSEDAFETTRRPDMRSERFPSEPEPRRSEDAFERRLPALRTSPRPSRPIVTANPLVTPKESSAVVPKLTHPLIDDLDLRDPRQLRRAVLLHEILGPPKSRRR
ncbi:MAG: hypothetical protein AAGJ10_06765 [Bacteroidota bacterium]